MHVLSDLQLGPKGHRLSGLHVKSDPDFTIQDRKTGTAKLRAAIRQDKTVNHFRWEVVDRVVRPLEEP